MIMLNFYLVPQIVHNAIKGQQSLPNYFYLYSLMASRSILPVINEKAYFYWIFNNLSSFILEDVPII